MPTLRDYREAARITQEAAAAALGIDRTSYTRIENGGRRLLASELAILAQLYGMPADLALAAVARPQVATSDLVEADAGVVLTRDLVSSTEAA